ncbi:MAG: DNA gyrase subunit B, partial [Pseudomonadota bacterium]
YIGQPPLYKIKKGKQEYYVKDDAELNTHLLRLALDNAKLYLDAESPPISGLALEELAKSYNSAMNAVNRLARKHDREILENVLFIPPLKHPVDQQNLTQWLNILMTNLNARQTKGTHFSFSLAENLDQDALLTITKWTYGMTVDDVFVDKFFNSADFNIIRNTAERLNGLLNEKAYVKRGDRSHPVADFREVMTWLMAQAVRGQSIQRYKGLGEMNPDQLWETTMDPESRRLMQVKIEDAVAADEVFTMLMGDQVEPRRNFIETNALTAHNIDI